MNAKIRTLLLRLRDDRRGLTTVEYAIVLCLIAAVVVTTWQRFGHEVKERLVSSTDRINDEMQKAVDDGK